MDTELITQNETGIWQIITITQQHILLFLPPDGRASIIRLASFRDLIEAASGTVELPSSELVTWGSYGVVTGMSGVIKVGGLPCWSSSRSPATASRPPSSPRRSSGSSTCDEPASATAHALRTGLLGNERWIRCTAAGDRHGAPLRRAGT
jgi:hypothetical protein